MIASSLEGQIHANLLGVSIDEYNELAQRVLERAQAVLGIRSAEAFAKLLADRGAGSPDGSTYRRWLRGENTIPAWALIAAAQVCDRDLSSLLAEAGTVLPDRGFAERMEAQERQVSDLRQQVAELRPLTEAMAETRRRLAEYEREIAEVRSTVGMAGPAPATEGALPAHFKERIDQLYRGLTDARHLLGLEPRSRPAGTDKAAVFRALHENLSEVRRAVGISQTPFPPEDETPDERFAILEDQMQRAWSREQLQQAKEADASGRAAEDAR